MTRPDIWEQATSQAKKILGDIDVQPQWHPLHDAFWYSLLEPAGEIRARLESDPDTRQAVWDVLTSEKKGGLENLARRVDKFVVPLLDETLSRSKEVGKYSGERDLENDCQSEVQTGK